MGLFEIFMIGVGLSMDAFAASICKGLNMRRLSIKNILIIGLFFGGFQALMPAVGWLLGKQFESYITSIDHWIAFLLLAFIGVNMIREALGEDEDEDESPQDQLDIGELFMLAVATSIDALAVGITFAFLKVNILPAVSIIGIITFVISFAGVGIGHQFGRKYEKKAELAGGIILICIGLKILLEHLGILF